MIFDGEKWNILVVFSDSLFYCRLYRGCLETFQAYEILMLKFEVVLIITLPDGAPRLFNSSNSSLNLYFFGNVKS